MKQIWKYELETTDYQEILMPLGADVLTVQVQNGKPCIWCLVNPNLTEIYRKHKKIWIYGTGHTIENNDDKMYIGSYRLLDERLVFHVFDGGYKL